MQTNCAIEAIHDRLFIVAIKDMCVNTELFVSYGAGYWEAQQSYEQSCPSDDERSVIIIDSDSDDEGTRHACTALFELLIKTEPGTEGGGSQASLQSRASVCSAGQQSPQRGATSAHFAMHAALGCQGAQAEGMIVIRELSQCVRKLIALKQIPPHDSKSRRLITLHREKPQMPRVQPDIFERAIALANKSTMQHQHGAVIVKNGQIIGEGFNYQSDFMCHQWSIHSEVAALLSIKKQHRNKKYLEDAVMVVVRVKPRATSGGQTGCGEDFTLKMSKPCERCKKAVADAGIKKVFYSCG